MKLIYVLSLVLSTLSLHAQRGNVKLAANATLVLQRMPFQATGKVLKFNAGKGLNGTKTLLDSNGHPVFGSDGEVPQYILQKALLLIGSHQYNLRVDGMYNPWFGTGFKDGPNPHFFNLKKIGNSYRLQALFSDGAGSYAAEWVIIGASTRRTVLTADDEKLTEYFSAVSK